MDSQTQPQIPQDTVNTNTLLTQPKDVTKVEPTPLVSNNGVTAQPNNEAEKVQQVATNHSTPAQNVQKTENLTDNVNNVENKSKAQPANKEGDIENKASKQPVTDNSNLKNESQTGAKGNVSETAPKGGESKPKKETQVGSKTSIKDSQTSVPNTGRSEVVPKENTNKTVKTKSQELKEKNQAKDSNTNNQQNAKKVNKDNNNQPKSNKGDKEKAEPTLEGAVASIYNFFTSTKDNIAQTSAQTAEKLEEVVMKNPIVTKIRGEEYKAVISSDLFQKEDAKPGAQKQQRIRANRSQAKAPTKVEALKSKKVTSDNTNEAKSPKAEAVKEKMTIRRVVSKPKVKPVEGSPGVSPLKGKNEVEEQIRIHKIDEIKKMKKVLQGKLDALNDQLFELQKPSFEAYHEGDAPARPGFNLEQYKKEQKEELTQKTNQAKEFAKKMIHERKDLEQKREQRREKVQALVLKDIDSLYQKQLNELSSVKGGSAKAKFESNIKKFKDDNMFASLEQKKKDLKKVREFHRNSTTGDAEQNQDQTGNEEGETKSKAKIKKPLYKSPVLEQVLREDEERKKSDAEKLLARKNLHKKLVDYGKEVKSTHLPQVHTSKYFETDEKISKAIHRSVNMEKNMVRLSGKEGLYGYLDKMRNKYPDLAKPNNHGNESQDMGKKSKAKRQEHYDDEEDVDNYSGGDGEDRVDRGEYELEQNWDLTNRSEREKGPRDSYGGKKGAKNLKGYQPNRKASAEEIRTPNDSRLSEISGKNNSKLGKKHQVAQRGGEVEDENNEWEEELRNDQDILKDKIANMLADVKSMESQIKSKEEKLLQDIEEKKKVASL